MGQVTVGIDPDADRLGVAVYYGSELVVCATATIVEIVTELLPAWIAWGHVKFSIEDVMANNFCYQIKFPQGIRPQARKKIEQDRMRKVGRCQQAQLELMRWLDHHGIPYVLHKPQKGNWAKDKATFERVTGWAGRSNEDSRAAAFFGFLALPQP